MKKVFRDWLKLQVGQAVVAGNYPLIQLSGISIQQIIATLQISIGYTRGSGQTLLSKIFYPPVSRGRAAGRAGTGRPGLTGPGRPGYRGPVLIKMEQPGAGHVPETDQPALRHPGRAGGPGPGLGPWPGAGPASAWRGCSWTGPLPCWEAPGRPRGVVVVLIDEEDYTRAATPLALWGLNLAGFLDSLAASSPPGRGAGPDPAPVPPGPVRPRARPVPDALAQKPLPKDPAGLGLRDRPGRGQPGTL